MFESEEFSEMPEQFNMNFAKSFLMQGGSYTKKNADFATALAKVVEYISAKKIPAVLLPPYLKFFEEFRPTEEQQQDMYSLKSLLELAKQIDANMTWVATMNKPSSVIVEAAWLNTDKQIDVSTILCQ
jgi:hypothetical protein